MKDKGKLLTYSSFSFTFVDGKLTPLHKATHSGFRQVWCHQRPVLVKGFMKPI